MRSGRTWRGQAIALILDHINGVPTDNRLENLRIVCPNCAATLISSRSWGGMWLTRNHLERVRVLRGTSCRTAKLIARAFDHSPGVNQPRGWSCFNGHRPQPFLFDCGKGLRGQRYSQFFEVYPTYRLW